MSQLDRNSYGCHRSSLQQLWAIGGPYNAEGTPLRQQLFAHCRMIQQTYPAMLEMIAAQMQLAQPLIEQEIYTLVCQLNI